MKRACKVLGAILAGLLALVGICGYGWLLWKGPWYFDRTHLRQRDLQPADGVVITGFRTMLVALGAGAITAVGLWYTSRNHKLARQQFTHTQEQFRLAQQQFEQTQEQFTHTQNKDREQAELAREGHVTDRYVEAIKLLGSGNITERLGGIYSLERIMHDSSRDAKTVIEVLAAFVRDSSQINGTRSAPESPTGRIAEDMQAAASVLARRPESCKETPVSLAGAKLGGVQLQGADLTSWDLRNADLSQANLQHTDLSRAYLQGAILSEAYMYRANLDGADLSQAVLTDTNLWGANMRESTLFNADLSTCLNLGRQQILDAIITYTTTLPADMTLDKNLEERMRQGERVADSRDPYNV
ncbi:pentapeptide repeat-containing protein [Streptomyces sp. NPDC127020]|uniref:pentapeptide repeat-containing protein n=1 Tax=Streptomyces sp. NPDC127020 TaxID=3347109 RepID=UPI00365EC12A